MKNLGVLDPARFSTPSWLDGCMHEAESKTAWLAAQHHRFWANPGFFVWGYLQCQLKTQGVALALSHVLKQLRSVFQSMSYSAGWRVPTPDMQGWHLVPVTWTCSADADSCVIPALPSSSRTLPPALLKLMSGTKSQIQEVEGKPTRNKCKINYT